MASPDQEFSRQLERYFEGTLSPEERTRVEQRLRADPAARRAYWEAARWNAALHTWGEQYAGRQEAKIVEFPTEPRSRRRVWLVRASAAAAVLVLGLVTFRALRSSSELVLAEVSFQREAALPRVLRAGEYTLSAGAVRFETTAGASVSVAAPARFRLTAADRIELASGRLTARMTRPEAQLTVKVRDLEVTDLGTAFGVDASAAGRALVSVFDGLVAVKTPTQAGELHLARGESLVHDRGDAGGTAKTSYDAVTFRELWPLTAGIDEASQLVEFLPPGPLLRPLRDYRADDRIFLFPERQSAVVQQPLAVDLAPDVRAWPDSPVSPYPVARGERVHSYLLFYQPGVTSSAGGVRRLSGEITFQHRVIGVICSDQGLDASDGVLGIAGADYSTPGQRRGLEEADKENYRGGALPHDSITIAPDGRTVRFDFHVSDEREQMRVLVARE